jgi:hypothetical protein
MRVARIQFKRTADNQAKFLRNLPVHTVEIDTQIDLMFECPGVRLSQGSQGYFYKIILKLHPQPERKSTFISLDRIRCSVLEISKYTPTDEAVWRSIRDMTLQRLKRDFCGNAYTTVSELETFGHTLIHLKTGGDVRSVKFLKRWNILPHWTVRHWAKP